MLASLLCGNAQQSLLSSAAIDSVLSQLQGQSAAIPAGSSQPQPAQQQLGMGTLHVLQASVFSPQVLLQQSSSGPTLREQAARATAACFAQSLVPVRAHLCCWIRALCGCL